MNISLTVFDRVHKQTAYIYVRVRCVSSEYSVNMCPVDMNADKTRLRSEYAM